METGLIAARFLHFAAVMALFGLALFPLYSYPGRPGELPARLGRWLSVSLRLAVLLAVASALVWGLLTVANMAGTLSTAADRDALLFVLRDTDFGRVWAARLLLAAALFALLIGRRDPKRQRGWATPSASALLLLSLAFVGHTQIQEGWLRTLHIIADGAHLLAAGTWLGGLLALGYLLVLARQSPSEYTADARAALVRFSGIGSIAVAVLVGSGLINAWFLVGSVGKLATTPYGQLLLVKLCLFFGMLALAALNRFHLVPSLVGAEQNSGPLASSLRRLRRSVLGERLLGLVIVLIVSFLGTMQPAIHVSQ
jgi:putative copper resistance protein D